ncbi:hypothetical protein HanRHA438_Chr02g0094961 [Helianthus annuus]|nr:hypothetical protein HanRHA438_Chr02g0094961 [Helianthus annuus]
MVFCGQKKKPGKSLTAVDHNIPPSPHLTHHHNHPFTSTHHTTTPHLTHHPTTPHLTHHHNRPFTSTHHPTPPQPNHPLPPHLTHHHNHPYTSTQRHRNQITHCRRT